jgi:hypothetical protein
MRIDLPDPSLVVLIGASGSGKSSLAARHFAPTEVVSSDFCRGLVADDENDQAATADAFAVLNFIAGKRLAQPRLTKCRGPEYLRIIYGPEYLDPSQLERLRDRNLGRKRSLAVREFALGVEALERLARGEPLYRVHECVFAVLALESEPVDPRL